jgi:ATP-dependent Lon protease
MLKDIQMLEIKHEIQRKVHTDIDQQQRDYFLRQQIKVLQDELGFDGPDKKLKNFVKRAKIKNGQNLLPNTSTRSWINF